MQLDHLMWGAADLTAAMDDAERRFGARPVPGGEHPRLGTRNALLGLDAGSYLEIIAPAGAGASTAGSFGGALQRLGAPGLVTFALGSDDLPAVAAVLAEQGYGSRGPVPTQRATPDGELLSWELLFPRAHPFGSLCPFFIDWGDCRHPSADLDSVGRLQELVLGTPAPAALRGLMAALSAPVDVVSAAEPFLCARLACGAATVVLESTSETVALRFG